MNYQKIWQKTLTNDEKLEYEFSISKRYRIIKIIIWVSLMSIFLLYENTRGLAITVILFVLFYYGFYLKVANAYALTNKRILVHKGWLSTRAISVDYNKITDIIVVEPFFSRIFYKSGHLAVDTAGTGLHEIVLRNISTPYETKKIISGIKK